VVGKWKEENSAYCFCRGPYLVIFISILFFESFGLDNFDAKIKYPEIGHQELKLFPNTNLMSSI
jgi:hypothetical protein